MTLLAQHAAAPAPSTAYDRIRARVLANPVLAQRIEIWAPIVITLWAALLRIVNLGHPASIVFDETYYVKDSWSQWNLGYPATWPEDVNDRFVAGETDLYSTDPSFVVHPPLGRFLIGFGMWIFGPASPTGWRIMVALFGVGIVVLVYVIAKALSQSFVFASIAAFLMSIDGLGISMSRIALLDTFLTFFILLGFWFVLKDRRWFLTRFEKRCERDSAGLGPWWGPIIWNRPWLIAAGAALGAATAVKWSGLYALAGLGIYVVVIDAFARRRHDVVMWPLDSLRQGLVAALLMVPTAFVVYLASWTGWLASDNGYDRHAVDAEPATGFWSWVPLSLQNLWKYHQDIYGFHVGLTTAHPYQSPAWQWPLLVRPTSMYWQQDDTGAQGCALPGNCVEAMSSIPNPLIWWVGFAAVVALTVVLLRDRKWQYGFIITGVAVTWLPWLLFPERTIFQFYTIAMMPFLVLALTTLLREIAGRPDDPPQRRRVGVAAALTFLIIVTVLSAFWYPLWTAAPVPYDFWRLHNWLPTWV